MRGKTGLLLAVLLATLTVVASCGGGGGGGGGSSNATSLAIKGTSGNAVNMNGTWTKCTRITADQQDQLQTVTMSGGSATMNLSVWSASTTANCQQTTTPDALLAVTYAATLGTEATATWTNGAGSTSPPSGISATAKATQATVVANSAALTLKSTGFVDYFNTNALCGKTNWAVNVATDVLACPAVFSPATHTDYWVVDDSAAQLKWYNQNIGTIAYQVDSINPLVK